MCNIVIFLFNKNTSCHVAPSSGGVIAEKEQVPDDVVDVLVLILREELLSNPLEYKWWEVLM